MKHMYEMLLIIGNLRYLDRQWSTTQICVDGGSEPWALRAYIELRDGSRSQLCNLVEK